MAAAVAEKLILAAERLMRAGRNADDLTSREIAAEAGASVGLVNYHFGSKDALIAAAADRIFADFAPRWDRVAAAAEKAGKAARESGADEAGAVGAAFRAGTEELKALLKDIAAAATLTAGGSEFTVRRELMEGDLTTTKFLAPVLRAILPPGTDERELRMACFFIVTPLQTLLLRHRWFDEWTGSDIGDRKQRDAVFDFLVDRILEPFAAKAGRGSTNTR